MRLRDYREFWDGPVAEATKESDELAAVNASTSVVEFEDRVARLNSILAQGQSVEQRHSQYSQYSSLPANAKQ